MAALGLFLTFLNSIKRRVDASKQQKGLVSEGIVLKREMENMTSLLFDATNTTAVFSHVLNTNLQEFKRIEAELAHLRRKLINENRLKRFIRAPTRTEQLLSIVWRLSTVKRHVELFAITAESSYYDYHGPISE